MSTLILKYDNVQLVWVLSRVNHSEGDLIPYVYVTASDKAETAYQTYKNYNQSNILQVGTWANDGGAGTTTATLNSTWDTVCSAFGINQKKASIIATSTYNWAPTQAMKDDFIINLMKYFPKTINRLTNTMTSSQTYFQRRNNTNYGLYASGFATLSNFRREMCFVVFDIITQSWYRVGWEYRTDNVNPGKVWLNVSKLGSGALTFPTSGIPLINPANPYPNIPDSESGGGDGPGIGSSDVNPVPPVPSISAVGSGMCRLYNPTVSQLIDLGAWLWGNGLDLTQLKKIFTDPMDIILGCSIFPVAMPGETTEHIMFGNLDSEVSAKVVSSQYTTRDLGTIEIPETYNSYLDYSPYTKIQLYLPYIGMKQLNTDEVMGKTLGVVYSIDLLSGACVAHVYVESQLMYEFGGTCNTQIPLTARDYTATVQSLLGIVGGAITAGVAAFALPEAIPAAAGAAGVIGGMAINSAKQTVGAKPTIEHASGIGGSTGIMASQHAYVIMEVPNLCHPPNQEHFTGYPGFIYGKVSDFEGYTKFINFEFINIHATEPELQELQDWFMNKGVRI